MNTIYFTGSTNNSYGRGKDKTKRKSRVGLLSGASGALTGGSWGAGVGLARGFLQPNKKKKKK